MDIEMLLVFSWHQSICQGVVTNALYCIRAFGAQSSQLCLLMCFRQDFSKYLEKKGVEEIFATPLQAHDMNSRDMLNSHGPGWEIRHSSAHCTHSSPLGWSCILRLRLLVWGYSLGYCAFWWFGVEMMQAGRRWEGRLKWAESLFLPTGAGCWSLRHGGCRQMAEFKKAMRCY